MRIPLDYYRILGIPIQVDDKQLEQAYRDRSWQMPRQEYSELAIAARKELLDRAYEVLSDSERRAEYEKHFLDPIERSHGSSLTQPPLPRTDESPESFLESHTPSVEIAAPQLAGALVILQELAEYELILKLGEPYLNNPQSVSPEPDDNEVTQTIKADITLSITLAHLELSREKWQRGEYERAALAGQRGLDLLEQSELFPGVRQEIRAELNKLRPYRVLEMLARQDDRSSQRQQGLQLLEAMLDARQGIDGKGDDGSGLSLDDFLRFIQQLRIHLSAQEQYALFQKESQRPSSVASYLTVYAAIALGFSQKKPAFIVEAQEILQHLEKRQDVYLEQAICALLLGQTELASLALPQSEDKEPLEFIQEKSQGSPDLLPGLCLYGEYWLKNDVFAHFRNLASREASLKDYFADEQVQAYLEKLPDRPLEIPTPSIDLKQTTGGAMVNTNAESQSFYEDRRRARREASGFTRSRSSRTQRANSRAARRTATLESPVHFSTGTSALKLRDYDEVPTLVPQAKARSNSSYGQPSPSLSHHSRLDVAPAPQVDRAEEKNFPNRPRRRKTKLKWKVNYKRLFLAIAMLFGLSALGMLLLKWLNPNRSPLSGLQGEQLMIQIDRPPVAIPPTEARTISEVPAVLTSESAKEIIEGWLSSKSQALGSNYNIESLKAVLAEPILSQWQKRAENLKNSNGYWQYQHQVAVKSFSLDPQNPNRATVEAQVREVGNYYQDRQLNAQRSYDDNLVVGYDLERQGEQWLIRAIAVK